jgi:ribosomal protein S4
MAPTIIAARQLISHGHIRVNAKKVNIASYMCKPKDVISVAMKERSLRLVNKNLSEYYQRMRFYKKRLEKTLAFVLFKLNIVPNMASALQLISQGLLKINNKRVRTPNSICTSRDVISITTKQGVRQIKLAEFFGTKTPVRSNAPTKRIKK